MTIANIHNHQNEHTPLHQQCYNMCNQKRMLVIAVVTILGLSSIVL